MLVCRLLLFVGSMIQVGISLNFHTPTLQHIAELNDKEVERAAVEHQMMNV